MNRKVFISFLGTNDYIPCNYYMEENPSHKKENVQYVQEAIIALCCKDFKQNDKFIFFLTEDSKTQNWENNGLYNKATEKYDKKNVGLKERLINLKETNSIQGKICEETIPEGYSSAQIWDIFSKIYDSINQGDEIILDITHGFRSLPMLAMVLNSYLKELKNIKVSGIYYGAFEKLGPSPVVSKKPLDQRNAPILSLLPLAELQQWTGAAREFLMNGNSSSLTNLLLIHDQYLSESFENFEKSISTCRGRSVTEEIDYLTLKSLVDKAQDNKIGAQIQPLLERIEEKLMQFENKSITRNGLAAVDWCIQHNMIQQGITFLQETMHTWVIEKTVGEKYLNDIFFRNIAASALNGYTFNKNIHFKDKNGQLKEDIHDDFSISEMKDHYNQMRCLSKELRKLYQELIGHNGIRNDINHCGFRENPKTPNELKESLNRIQEAVKQILIIN